MINQSTITELKKQYGEEIYSVHIGKQDYVFRTLTFGEYKNFTHLNLTSAELEEVIVNIAVVYPEGIDLDKLLPGSVSALADEILEYSSFDSIEKTENKLNEARQSAMHGVEMMKAFILAAMPSYKYEELDNKTIQGLATLLAISELILDIQLGIANGNRMILELVDPTEQEQSKSTHSFSLEDLDRANRNLDGQTRLGTASSNDPIAQKLRQALGG